MANPSAIPALSSKDAALEEFVLVDSTSSAGSLSQEAALALVGKIRGIVENEKQSDQAKKSVDTESEDRFKQLEEQLAITKLQLVESECQCQQLQLSLKQLKGESQNNATTSSSGWFRNGLRS